MLASNFYRENMGRGRGNNRRDAVSAPKLTAGTSKSTAASGRGRGKGRPPVVSAAPRRQILVEVNRNRDHDDAENEVDSDKENQELDDLVVDPQVDDTEQEEEEEETEEEFDWKCRLLEMIQLYPEVFDLADPRYKDRNQRDAAWEEIATAMEATGQSKYMYFVEFEVHKVLFSTLYTGSALPFQWRM